MRNRKISVACHALVGLALCASLSLPATAQRRIADEYEKSIKSAEAVGALGNDLFGDEVNLYTGGTTFTATDINLPGNSGLSVSLSRKFSVESRDGLDRTQLSNRVGGFWDWDLDIPHLQGTFAGSTGWQLDAPNEADRDKRCSNNTLVPPWSTVYSLWSPPEYWHGNSLVLPGGGFFEMLGALPGNTAYRPSAGGPYPWVTNNQWAFSCLATTAPGNNVPGEGFLATAPDGVRYWFDWIVSRQAGMVTRPGDTGGGVLLMLDDAHEYQRVPRTQAKQGNEPAPNMAPVGSGASLSRVEVWILPTRIEDRHGNWVTYTYNPASPWQLTRILANDGREITLNYDAAGHIATAIAGTRTWTYSYTNGSLSQVLLPDSSKWQISFANLLLAYTTPDLSTSHSKMCDLRSSSTTQTGRIGTITHPSGATGEFSFISTLHGRSYSLRACPGWRQYFSDGTYRDHNYAYYPRFFDIISLTKKKISGPGQSAIEWNYNYGSPNASWTTECSAGCVTTKTVSVTGPTDFKRYTFANRYRESEGKLLKVESGPSSASILRTENSTYLYDATGQAYPATIGVSGDERGDGSAERHSPLISKQTTQQGQNFTWQVPTGCGTGYCFDQYARPTKVVKSSSP